MQKTDLTNSLTASYIFGKPPEINQKAFFDILKNKRKNKTNTAYMIDIVSFMTTYDLTKNFHDNKD